VAGYGKKSGFSIIILDFNEARDDEVAVASTGPHASHKVSS